MTSARLSISTHKLTFIFCFFIQAFIVCLCCVSGSVKLNIYLSFIQLLTSLVIFKYKTKLLFSFSALFVLCSYILHMAALLLAVLAFDTKFQSLSGETLSKSVIFFILCHFALTVGACVSLKTERFSLFKNIIIDKKTLAQVGLICFIVGAVFRVGFDLNQIRLFFSYGRLYSMQHSGESGLFGKLGKISFPGVLCLLLALDKRKKKQAAALFILVSAWVAFSMLSAGRIYQISFLISLAYIYFSRIHKLKLRELFGIGIICALLCVYMNAIANYRSSYELTSGKNGMIAGFLLEMGGTMESLTKAVDEFNKAEDFGYGSSYTETVLSTVVPFYYRNLPNLNQVNYVKNFKDSGGMGGSWVGEAYYNFCWLGFLPCLIFGVFIGSFENIFNEGQATGNYLKSLLITPFLLYTIAYARCYVIVFSTSIQLSFAMLLLALILRRFNKNYCAECSSLLSLRRLA